MCPRRLPRAGLKAALETKADGLVAVGGGAAIGLAKAIALQTALPILAVPTTYSGSEATPIYGMTDGERKITGRDLKVVPRTILYDPDLTLGLPAAVSAASGMNAIAHCVEALWVDGRTPVTVGLASEAMRRFAQRPAGSGRRWLQCRRADRLPDRRVACGNGVVRRHRAPAQACPCARRAWLAACRGARDHPAPCHAL